MPPPNISLVPVAQAVRLPRTPLWKLIQIGKQTAAIINSTSGSQPRPRQIEHPLVGVNAGQHHVTRRRHHQPPLEQRDDDEQKQDAVSEERPASARKNQLAGSDRQRGDDRSRAEDLSHSKGRRGSAAAATLAKRRSSSCVIHCRAVPCDWRLRSCFRNAACGRSQSVGQDCILSGQVRNQLTRRCEQHSLYLPMPHLACSPPRDENEPVPRPSRRELHPKRLP